LKSFLKMKSRKLDPKFFNIMCFGEQYKLLNKGKEAINRKIDILFILRKLLEIDKLKQVLLTQS
jgi:hypothetical protein